LSAYEYDAVRLQEYIQRACGLDGAVKYPDLYAGIGKLVGGEVVGAFTVKGISGGVYEFAGAVSSPFALRRSDYAVMVDYLRNKLKPRAVIAFSAASNVKAHRFLAAFGFTPCGIVDGYFGPEKNALIFQLGIDSYDFLTQHSAAVAHGTLTCAP